MHDSDDTVNQPNAANGSASAALPADEVAWIYEEFPAVPPTDEEMERDYAARMCEAEAARRAVRTGRPVIASDPFDFDSDLGELPPAA